MAYLNHYFKLNNYPLSNNEDIESDYKKYISYDIHD